jgi:antitoxin component of MazEF toxin-antitoxin module
MLPKRYPKGYPLGMKRMRIRRIGNSNMVALPSELEEAGYRPGVEVLVQATPEGELRIVRADLVHESTRDLARRLAERHRRTLERLADHDRQR